MKKYNIYYQDTFNNTDLNLIIENNFIENTKEPPKQVEI